MDYTITEASKLLKISRVTIYKKIEKLSDLHNHIVVKNNNKYIDKKGLEIIKKSLNETQHCKEFTPELDNKCKEFTPNTSETPIDKDFVIDVNLFTSMQTTYTNSLQEIINELKNDKDKQIEDLHRQLNVKDTQIQSLTDALGTSQRLNENNQVLLQQSQQKILFLEEANSVKKNWWEKMFT
ncbi:MAG: hypothetical protein ACD_26C00055G0001 [uncultured bacterium]|nr:MAG: hypothetical protein ACD_26C00055G0001 [uncultured bacterium]HAO52062.1 hypothetical protein [Candidatus Magasanikbacteria bacterium]